MKKFGFTLAEVLITLGIIGVISALVMPTFTANTQRSKIGPKLAKAVSTFEQATQAVLDDAQSDSIIGAQVQCSSGSDELSSLSTCFYDMIEHHLKGSADGNAFTSTDGTHYEGKFDENITEELYTHDTTAMKKLTININPNADESIGGNIFYFRMMDDGTLIPWGSQSGPADEVWTTKCNIGDTVSNEAREYCAGHVMENNLKVEYKLK